MKLSSQNGHVVIKKDDGLQGVWAGNATPHDFQIGLELGEYSSDSFTGPAVEMNDGKAKQLTNTQGNTIGVFKPVV